MDMTKPEVAKGCAPAPINQLIKPPTNDPAIPIPTVWKNPAGSLPGCKALAMRPTIKPKNTKINKENIYPP